MPGRRRLRRSRRSTSHPSRNGRARRDRVAIGNALHAATGLRVRNLPLTPENVVAAMDVG